MTARRPMTLAELLKASALDDANIVVGSQDTKITGISDRAQKTGQNEMFVSIAGTKVDGHMLLGEAIRSGANTLVVEKDISDVYPGVSVIRVPSTRIALGKMLHAFYGHPSRSMKVCGVTGTNGKTTTSHLIHSILKRAGARPARIGTLGAVFNDADIPLNTTTPGARELVDLFCQMEEEKINHVAMECSSHSIDQARIAGIQFNCGGLIGITQDHLDYHGSFENYIKTKKRFFHDYVATTPGSTAAINLDDGAGLELTEEYAGDWIGYSRNSGTGCAVSVEDARFSSTGTSFKLIMGKEWRKVESPLLGDFNLTNVLAAATCAHIMGVDFDQIADGICHAPPIPGRFEYFYFGQPFAVIVDYAHTPDALVRVLRTARRLCQNRLIVVFGCGGDRDRAKRPMMGKAVGDLADFAIVTNDNPRNEDPEIIARQTVEGLLQSELKSNRYQILLDRRMAIEKAIQMAAPGDTVIIAGKGHEDYQEVGTTRHPFDDREIVRNQLKEIANLYHQPDLYENALEQKL